MDFQYVLGDLISSVEGALGVMFMDSEGETVEALGCTGSIHDLKVLGAYQGIFLSQAKAVCRETDQGKCQEIALRIGNATFLTRQLPEGYYVTLILSDQACEGLARQRLIHAGEKIAEILF
jgi:predicted regulator of Ras-like GTPase activity (Roadblock/LC7/MglB family)